MPRENNGAENVFLREGLLTLTGLVLKCYVGLALKS
jgi:hypothetical protein